MKFDETAPRRITVPPNDHGRTWQQHSYNIVVDAGHVCQNLYMACTALGAGTCAIAAYDQVACDRLLGVDGDEEFTLYVAPVGKRRMVVNNRQSKNRET